MAESFDAVLAEMRANSRFENGRWVHDAATGAELERWADRLQAAHEREVVSEADDAMASAMLRALEDPHNQWFPRLDRMKIAYRAAFLAHGGQEKGNG